jgi:hypothetical protein
VSVPLNFTKCGSWEVALVLELDSALGFCCADTSVEHAKRRTATQTAHLVFLFMTTSSLLKFLRVIALAVFPLELRLSSKARNAGQNRNQVEKSLK